MIIPIEIITDIEELKKQNVPADLYESKTIIEKLEIALKNSSRKGVGLAAPQIGIHKHVAIIRLKEGGVEEYIDLVNPKIIEMENGITVPGEGCLSLPNTHVNTRRFEEVFIKDDLHPAGLVAYGTAAVVIQHEIDHLNQILITDRAAGKNKVGRNDPCPCGSGLKFKKCHGK